MPSVAGEQDNVQYKGTHCTVTLMKKMCDNKTLPPGTKEKGQCVSINLKSSEFPGHWTFYICNTCSLRIAFINNITFLSGNDNDRIRATAVLIQVPFWLEFDCYRFWTNN